MRNTGEEHEIHKIARDVMRNRSSDESLWRLMKGTYGNSQELKKTR